MSRFEELSGGRDNVLRFGFASGERGYHEAQKPLALLRSLIEMTTVPGHMVLDPFAGSGSTALAALQTDRRYLAIERDENIFRTAKERLRE